LHVHASEKWCVDDKDDDDASNVIGQCRRYRTPKGNMKENSRHRHRMHACAPSRISASATIDACLLHISISALSICACGQCTHDVFVCAYACLHAYTHPRTHACMYVFLHLHINIDCVHRHAHASNTHTETHAHIHTCTHTHTRMHTRMHTCMHM
jgi:hypothetical protein